MTIGERPVAFCCDELNQAVSHLHADLSDAYRSRPLLLFKANTDLSPTCLRDKHRIAAGRH
jgi:hypothetical protein